MNDTEWDDRDNRDDRDEHDEHDEHEEHDQREEPPTPPRKRHRRRSVVVLLVVVVLPLVLAGGAVAWVGWQLNPPGGPGREIEVTLERGWGVSEIADELARRGVIGSAFVFEAYTRIKGAGPFQAGDYTLRRRLGVRGAVDALGDGPLIAYVDLAVPPGLRLSEIAQRVGRLPGRSGRRFLKIAGSGRVRSRYQPEGVGSLEGLLWPDTYRVSEGEDELDILRTMVERFDAEADRLGLATTPPRGRTPYETVVVASLIQSEAKIDGDRPLIASVIYNRLRQDMRLQIDATVLYAIGERKPSNTAADRATDSPYNTYKVAGLPPTPISSVTAVSLKAAMAPAETPFLYYVLAGEDGHHAFAQTYEEHLANVAAARAKGLLG